MKTSFHVISTLLLLFFLSACATSQQDQLLGRIDPGSPTDLEPGRNDITFFSNGIRIVGHLYLPPGGAGNRRLPVLIMVAPESGVKEQSPGDYASRLSRKGYLTLAFDHRSFGASGGTPRLVEDPFLKVEDIKNAVSYARSLTTADPQRIGLVGICAGAGYAIAAAAFDSRIKAVATSSGVFDFTDFRPNIRNEAAQRYFGGLLQLAGKGRQQYFETGETGYLQGAFYGEEPQGEKTLAAYYRGSLKMEKMATLFWRRASDYYHDPLRGQVNGWEDRRLLPALDTRFALNATSLIHLLSPRPVLFIKGSRAISGYATDIAYKKAGDPKEIAVIDGAHHFDLYDHDTYLETAMEKLDSFFHTVFYP